MVATATPTRGPKRQWKDVIGADLKHIGVPEADWFDDARTSRAAWRATSGGTLISYDMLILYSFCTYPSLRSVNIEDHADISCV